MEIIETNRIDVRMKYDMDNKKVTARVYSKVEDEKTEVHVGYAIEDPAGTGRLTLLEEYKHKDYIKQDFETLKEEFGNYANFWRARQTTRN